MDGARDAYLDAVFAFNAKVDELGRGMAR